MKQVRQRHRRAGHAIGVAGQVLTVKSGQDTKIAGANLEGNKVALDVGRNLTVASRQDTSNSRGSNWSIGGTATLGAGAALTSEIGVEASAETGDSANIGFGKDKASSAWVNKQTSIIGKEEVDIYVEKNTHVEGAVIAAENGNLRLDTDTLTYNDIYDHDTSTGYQASLSGSQSAENAKNNERQKGEEATGETGSPYAGTLDGSHSSKDRRQINRATIGEGEIIIRSDPDAGLEGLNRDLAKAQEITRDEKTSVTVYIDTSAIEEVLDGFKGIAENLQTTKERIEALASYLKEKFPDSEKQIDAQMQLRDRLQERGLTEKQIKQAQILAAPGFLFDSLLSELVEKYGSIQAIPNDETALFLAALKEYSKAPAIIPVNYEGENPAVILCKMQLATWAEFFETTKEAGIFGLQFARDATLGQLYVLTGLEKYKKYHLNSVARSLLIFENLAEFASAPIQAGREYLNRLHEMDTSIDKLWAEGKADEAIALEGKFTFEITALLAAGTGGVKKGYDLIKYPVKQLAGAVKHGVSPKYITPEGHIKWPDAKLHPDGFHNGIFEETSLKPGTIIDRYGDDAGKFLSPEGTPFEARALPKSSKNMQLKRYRVLKPLPVKQGKATPWFDQPGMGTQFKTDMTIKELIINEFIDEVE